VGRRWDSEIEGRRAPSTVVGAPNGVDQVTTRAVQTSGCTAGLRTGADEASTCLTAVLMGSRQGLDGASMRRRNGVDFATMLRRLPLLRTNHRLHWHAQGYARLSALREVTNDPRSTDGQLNPRMVKSIQQSLAAEGYVYSEETVREIGLKVLGE
jgi:hypothetical protein